ncbi:MAG: hypothetical protein JW900_02445 [Anaerolineae bacterium]|nr:hypothetical protein [Anaerolineae bacterium]
MDYRYIFRRALRITRHHKRLLLFAFLAALMLPGRMGLSWRDLPPDVQNRLVDVVYSDAFIPLVVLAALLALAVSLTLAVLRALGRAALVQQANRVENGGALDLAAGWKYGKEQAGRVFVVRFLLALPALLVFSLGFTPYILSAYVFYLPAGSGEGLGRMLESLGFFLACSLPAVGLALVWLIPARLLQRLAVRACLLEKRPPRAGIARGWGLVKENAGRIAVLWAALALIDVGLFLFFRLPIAAATAALFLPLLILIHSSPVVGWVGIAAVISLFWLLGMTVEGLREVLFSVSWTLGYRELTGLGRTGEEEWLAESALL